MPYLKYKDKVMYDEAFDQIKKNFVYGNSGHLCYCIYKLMLIYLEGKVLSFSILSEIMGAIECAKQEFYRRKVSSYEDIKIKENGDVA